MNCKACGHRNDQHGKLGCNQGFCKCELSNDDVVNIDNFTALRAAAEQMAERLRDNRSIGGVMFDSEDAAALDEWNRVSQ
jgi:hypothetical protein